MLQPRSRQFRILFLIPHFLTCPLHLFCCPVRIGHARFDLTSSETMGRNSPPQSKNRWNPMIPAVFSLCKFGEYFPLCRFTLSHFWSFRTGQRFYTVFPLTSLLFSQRLRVPFPHIKSVQLLPLNDPVDSIEALTAGHILPAAHRQQNDLRQAEGGHIGVGKPESVYICHYDHVRFIC